MDLSKFTFSFSQHKGKDVIFIKFPFSYELKNQLKERFPSVRWSSSNKMWYLPDIPSVRNALQLEQRGAEVKQMEKIHIVNQPALSEFANQLKLKAYSSNTIRMYVSEFSHLLVLLHG